MLLHIRRSYFLYVRGFDLHRCTAQDVEADINFGFPVGRSHGTSSQPFQRSSDNYHFISDCYGSRFYCNIGIAIPNHELEFVDLFIRNYGRRRFSGSLEQVIDKRLAFYLCRADFVCTEKDYKGYEYPIYFFLSVRPLVDFLLYGDECLMT